MGNLYQHLPEHVSPVIFSVGNLSVHWYSIMWIIAFGIVYILLRWRINKGEGNFDIVFIQDILINAFVGAIIGGRLGYVIFYDLGYYLAHPLQIISPYDFAIDKWIGIYGMSYHGGIIGISIALAWSAYKNKKDIITIFDFIVPAVPLGFMFGRVGNFFNGELVGRVTTSPFGMYFNNESVLRHPSQLYEAFFEGLVLFVILWPLRNYKLQKGMLGVLYLIGYSMMRFGVEFFREPDEQLGFVVSIFTMGQILSVVMFIVGICIFLLLTNNKIGFCK